MVERRLYTTCVDGKLRVWSAEHLIKDTTAISDENPIHQQKKLQEIENKLDRFNVHNDYGSSDEVSFVKEMGGGKIKNIPNPSLKNVSAITEDKTILSKTHNLQDQSNILSKTGNLPGIADDAVDEVKKVNGLINNTGVTNLVAGIN